MPARNRIALLAITAVTALLWAASPAAARTAEPEQASPLNVSGKIVFASDRDGDYEIYAISHGGTALAKLTDNSVDDYSPSWSPDGSRIVFARDFGDPDYELMFMNADGTDQERLRITEWPELDPTWSPDGNWIAYAWGGFPMDGGDVNVMHPSGEHWRTVAASDENSVNRDPTWSPNSRRLAFVVSYDGSDIYVAKRCCNGGSIMRALTEREMPSGGTHKTDLDWAPRGSVIGFTEDSQMSSLLGTRFELAFVDPKTKERWTIPTPFYSARFGAWGHSGDSFLISANPSWNAGGDLYLVSADGTRRFQLTTDPASDIDPDWFQHTR